MRKLVIAVLGVAALGGFAWVNKVSLLVWGLPHLQALALPVAENRPVDWQAGPAKAKAPPGERPPNIILILADDLGYNDVSFTNGGAGDGSLQTPSIDALAQAGVTFAQGYAANAVCAPSRASILTGRYATRFGFEFTPFPKVGATIFQWLADEDPSPLPIYIDHDAVDALPDGESPGMPPGSLGLPPEEVTLAEALQARGYYTAHIGKWHLGASPGLRPQDQGFDDSLNMRGMLYAQRGTAAEAQTSHSIERMVWASARYAVSFNGGGDFQPEGYLTDYYTAEAVQVIERNRHRPFFLYLAHWAVHNPMQAAQADYDALAGVDGHALRVYSGMIRALDRSVGELVAALEATGLTDNTLIVFTSDNGGAGYLGLADVNRPFRGWKLSHFEGGLRVPFIAKWPARIPAGSRMQAPVHHIDLFPTLAAAAGARLPAGRVIDGVDLLPYIRGEKRGAPHEALFWREGHHQAALYKGWKLIRAQRPDKRWLYHLAEDPTERRNLAAERPDMLARLEALLAEHNAGQAEPRWPSVIDSPQLIDKHHLLPYEPGDDYIYWPN